MSVTGGEPDSWCRARGTNTTGQVSHTTHLGSDSHSDTDKKLVSTIRNCDPAALRPGSQQAFPNTESKLGSHTRVTGEFNSREMSVLGGCKARLNWEVAAMSWWRYHFYSTCVKDRELQGQTSRSQDHTGTAAKRKDRS